MQLENAVTARGEVGAAFEIEKAIAALGFLVQKTGESMYPLLKMMYLADKLHLERFGRFIAGDDYCAMAKGPVPSHAYNIIQTLRGDKSRRPGAEVAAQFFEYGDDFMLHLRREPDLDELSSSDIECLQEIVDIYQRVGKWAIKDMSHDDAWKGAWRASRFSFRKSIPMEVCAIASQFEDGQALKAHLEDSNPGDAEIPQASTA